MGLSPFSNSTPRFVRAQCHPWRTTVALVVYLPSKMRTISYQRTLFDEWTRIKKVKKKTQKKTGKQAECIFSNREGVSLVKKSMFFFKFSFHFLREGHAPLEPYTCAYRDVGHRAPYNSFESRSHFPRALVRHVLPTSRCVT